MKGISLHEPRASAIAWDLKRIETRGFRIHWRGDLAICAAQTPIHADTIWRPDYAKYFRQVGIAERKQLAIGCIVAVCRVSHVLPTEELRESISAQEWVFGGYGDGRFGWILDDLKRLKRPIPFRGQQGIFTIPHEVISQMEFV